MAEEVVDLLRPVEEGVIVDATFGGGGHSRRIVEEMGDRVQVIGIDRDPDAAGQAVPGVPLLRGDFRDLDALLDEAGVGHVSAVLFDFGVSGHQLDEPARGFSYREPGPLDMRMDPSSPTTAADIVNTWDQARIADVLDRYGEEKHASRIAAAIVRERPIADTARLAEVVASAYPARDRRSGHPARKTFQALRIAVNDELTAIASGLDAGIARLGTGGRCIAISYHSLEDRIVKRRFAAGVGRCTCPPELPVCACGAEPELRLLTRGALRPSENEVAENPRARSARLRGAEKVAA